MIQAAASAQTFRERSKFIEPSLSWHKRSFGMREELVCVSNGLVWTAVVLFTQAPIPLPRHSHRFATLLLESAFVNVQSDTAICSEQRTGLARDSVHYRPVVPGRVGEKVLQNLIVIIRNRFSHPLHVPFFGLHQAAQILLRCGGNVVIARTEEIFEVLTKSFAGRAKLFERLVMVNPAFGLKFR